MSNQRKKAYLALLTTSFIWGIAPPLIKYTLNYAAPETFLFYRFLIVSLIMFIPLVIKIKRLKPSRGDWLKYLILGFLGTPLTLLLLFWGVNQTSATESSVIGELGPIWVILGGVWWLKEKITRQEKLGVALILSGTLIAIIQPLLSTDFSHWNHLFGNVLVFLSTLVWAGFSLFSRRERQLDPFVLTAVSFIVGFFILLPKLLIKPALFSFQPTAVWGIVYMAVLGSVVAYFTYIYGFSKIEASEATIFSYLQPIFAVPISVIFLKETVSRLFLLGSLFIIAGVFICETRRRLLLSRS